MSELKRKRMTKQKKVIYDILCSTETHPTADWIYNEARKQIPEISLGTVYRNLHVLQEDGKIIELTYGKDQCRYDGCITPHYHFVCMNCGKVLDFAPDCPQIGQDVLDSAPGLVKEHRLECYGLCRDCMD